MHEAVSSRAYNVAKQALLQLHQLLVKDGRDPSCALYQKVSLWRNLL